MNKLTSPLEVTTRAPSQQNRKSRSWRRYPAHRQRYPRRPFSRSARSSAGRITLMPDGDVRAPFTLPLFPLSKRLRDYALAVIARNTARQIVTRILSCSALHGAMCPAWFVLQLKADVVCSKVHVTALTTEVRGRCPGFNGSLTSNLIAGTFPGKCPRFKVPL